MAQHPVESDWRLFTSLVRFDAVYHGHFKLNVRRIIDYPSLWGSLRDLYQIPGVASTVDKAAIGVHHLGLRTWYRLAIALFTMPLVPLIFLLPLLSALLVLVSRPERGHQRANVAFVTLALAFAGSVAALVGVVTHGAWSVRFYDSSSAWSLALPIGFLVDRLSALMMVLISGVGTLIFRYSIAYMFDEPGYGRFLALIGVTTSVLLCMVASVNLVMLFICWQLLSFLLYLLAHNLTHEATFQGAVRTFRFLRFGDAAFLAGIVLAHSLYGTIEFRDLFARAAAHPITLHPLPGVAMSGATAVTLLLFVGAMSKSVQFPLHLWLPRSLYAPTPVTALLHAGIINAGGFLLNRLAPLYATSPSTLHVVFVIGMITAMFGASMMLTQNDIKKTLGFSTIGQMGYMVMECGLGAFALAVFHLIAHGMFKATVFLNCGNVIHKAREEPVFPLDPSVREGGEVELPLLTWATGLFTALLMPIFILLVAHGVLHLGLFDSQGAVIFLFLIWVTSSQAILTLTRLRAVASWKVAATMLITLLVLVVTYLFAAERFTEFLYPDRQAVASFFRAAALPEPVFDGVVLVMALVVIVGWVNLWVRSRGGRMPLPRWADELQAHLYVLFMNHLYLEHFYAMLGQAVTRLAAGRRKRPRERAL